MPKRVGFDLPEFIRFAKNLRIDTKERGLIPLGNNLSAPQMMFLKQIQLGFAEGQHEFIVLKARQLGISTISLALDLYWLYKHQGIQAALVTHEDGARDQFRTQLQLYRSTIPAEWRVEERGDNVNQLVLDNGSRLRFLVAGTTAKRGSGSSKLGRSGALLLAHSTEVAFWGDFSGVDSLRASFANENPDRLYVWESTANGYNGYQQMWEEAKRSVSVRPIFISWWLYERYRLPEASKEFQIYWKARPRLSADERVVSRAVEKEFDYEIGPAQWAWYRWMSAEKITDEQKMSQEYPHLPEMAFISTGRSFFTNESMTWAMRSARAHTGSQGYRIHTGNQFHTIRLVPAREATLRIWAPPVKDAYYVIGADPSFGENPDSDMAVISIWRVWYNRAEQVAEYGDNEISTHVFAWIMAYLAGWYENSTVNLEIAGPGQAVLAELKNLRRQTGQTAIDAGEAEARMVLKHVREYVYRKFDSVTQGQAWHTKTTREVKERMMSNLRDYLERQMWVPASPLLAEELQWVQRHGGAPEAMSPHHDDRVISAALAVMAWNDELRAKLLTRNIVWREGEPDAPAERTMVGHILQNWLVSAGVIAPSGEPVKVTASRGPPRSAVAGAVAFGLRRGR